MGTSHAIDLSSLAEDTLYYYRVHASYDQYDGPFSRVYSFRTPHTVDTSVISDMSWTGAISLSGATSTGVVFDSATGSIVLRSLDGISSVSFRLDGLTIVSSGWDRIIQSPEILESPSAPVLGDGYAPVGPIYRIGSSAASLAFSGQSATVSLSVGIDRNGEFLTVHRSDDNGSTFSRIGSCTVVSGICTFTTDHFSLFAFGEPTDTIPEAFSIPAQTGVSRSTEITSNTLTLSGYNAPTTISITGGSYSIGSGAFTTSNGYLPAGETVRVRLISSSAYSTTTSATLTIGGIVAAFIVTTGAQPVTTGGSSGGGGGASLSRDVCPEGDHSPSYYDGHCGIRTTSSTGTPNTTKTL